MSAMVTSTLVPDTPAAPARLWALVPCAGSGSRAGTAQPKQYQVLAGRPMVEHTLAAFAAVPRLAGTLVVLAPGDTSLHEQPAEHLMVAACGGATRAESVLGGLVALRARGAAAHDWVLVHDAARCLITPELINTLIDACQHDNVGGLLALRLPDTLKRGTDGRVAQTIDRSDKWLAQTPQMFRLGLLEHALRQAGAGVTDESSAMEAAGFKPLLVDSTAANFKVTYPQDFALAQALLRQRAELASTFTTTTTP